MQVEYFVKDGEFLGSTQADPPRVGELICFSDATKSGFDPDYFQVLHTLRKIHRVEAKPEVKGTTAKERLESLEQWVRSEGGLFHLLRSDGRVVYHHEVCEVLVKKISQELWALLTETHP